MQSSTASLIPHRLWAGAGIKRVPPARISHSQLCLWGRQALEEETVDVPVSLRARVQSWLHAVGMFLHPRGISGREGCRDGAGHSCHTRVQAPAAGHVPTLSVPCFVPRNPDGKARVGVVGTWLSRGVTKSWLQNLFHARTLVLQHSPPGRTLRLGRTTGRCFPVPLLCLCT